MKIKRLFIGLVAILMALSLLSCGGAVTVGDETEPKTETQSVTESRTNAVTDAVVQGLVLTDGSKSDYKIIYPEGTTSDIMRAVNALVKKLKESGANVTKNDDFLANGESAGEKEILVGNTNRTETATVYASLGERDYTAKTDGEKLVLLGKTDALTIKAVETFIAKLTLDEKSRFIVTEEQTFLLTGEKTLQVSFLGDSISTYEGYSNNGSTNSTLSTQPVWYDSSKLAVNETWWYRTAEGMGWEICVDNAYSGGRVSNSYCYDTMAKNLHNSAGVKPNVIIIYYGINDYNNSVALSEFRTAYAKMLDVIAENYPDATVYCCTLIPVICTSYGRNTTLEKNTEGVAIADFNSAIVNVASIKGANVIDFATEIGKDQYQYTFDYIHPKSEGMKRMSDTVLKILQEDFA